MSTPNSRDCYPPKTKRLHPWNWPIPAKALVTMIVVMLSLGMVFAGGQVLIHDIIPTLFVSSTLESSGHDNPERVTGERGDLFDSEIATLESPPFYKSDEFIFALKFTHIHIFGMSAIFFLMGAIVLFLNLSTVVRTWLIILPFIGIMVDLAAVWLKLFVHPAFFWLHMPGGTLLVIIFTLDACLILLQMWLKSPTRIKGENEI